VAKRRVGKYPKEFRRMAVERLKACDNIVELSQELGVHRRLLYKWRDEFDPFDSGEEPSPGNSRESALRKEINQLKRVVLEKTLELDFFKGAKSRGSTPEERYEWREAIYDEIQEVMPLQGSLSIERMCQLAGSVVPVFIVLCRNEPPARKIWRCEA